MTNTGIRIACVFAFVAAAAPHVSRAQGNDTAPTDSAAERRGLWARPTRASGARAPATCTRGARSSVAFDWRDERWTPVAERDVFPVFGNGGSCRANPL